jgi:uroporphyrinogen decarboxylase
MTRRERVHLALSFRPTDRPPVDLGSTRVTGIAAWGLRPLRQALGLGAAHGVRVFDLSQFLAEVDPEVLDALGCDFCMLPLQVLPLELPRTGWRPFTFWDGQTFLVPEHFHPAAEPDGSLLHGYGHLWQKVERRMSPGCRYFERTHSAEIDSVEFEIPHLEERDWHLAAPFTEEYLRREQDAARALLAATDRALVSSGALGVPVGYGGLIGWAMKMRTDPSHAQARLAAEAEALCRRIGPYLQAVGDYLDVLVLSTHDFGTQRAPMFDPELFREFFVPAWRLLTGAIHAARPALKIFLHSCGAVRSLVPHFIAAGIDILNPVQWSADDMNRGELARQFGGRIVFWGGAAHNQRTLPFGSPQEVRREVRQSIELFTDAGRRGGYVTAPIHNIQADVPAANIVALYEEARK